MNPEKLAGALLIVGFDGTTLPAALLRSLQREERAGVFLFKRNIASLESLSALCEQVRKSAKALPPVRAIDQEGGRVARLGAPCLRLPSARALGSQPLALLQRTGAAVGRELAALGLSLNAAPVLDVDSNPDNPVIGDRAYARDAARVIACARAYAQGLQRHVDGCGKHFPGHGDTALDSHVALPSVARDEAALRAIELAPFAALASELSALMSAHVRYLALDAERPATLSPRIATELLRAELRYDGPLLSDDLQMKALSGALPERAILALAAGCDGLLVCSDEAASEACFDALVREIERSPALRQRAAQAAARMQRLRQRKNAADAEALQLALREHAALQNELDALCTESSQ